MSVGVIVLAAGKGTRMKSDLAKVLHTAAGRTLLEWTFSALADVDVREVCVVVGHQADAVAAACDPTIHTALQEPQHGTGHAATVGLTGLDSHEGPVLIVPGDMPLIRSASLASLVDHHVSEGAAATVLSVDLDDPTGYGRIIRVGDAVSEIVEERDATDEQRRVTEVNTSVYVFDGSLLAAALDRITPDNDQGEYYLTDTIAMLRAKGERVGGYLTEDAIEVSGINNPDQLAALDTIWRSRNPGHEAGSSEPEGR